MFRKALMKHLSVDVPLIDAIYDYRRVSIGIALCSFSQTSTFSETECISTRAQFTGKVE